MASNRVQNRIGLLCKKHYKNFFVPDSLLCVDLTLENNIYVSGEIARLKICCKPMQDKICPFDCFCANSYLTMCVVSSNLLN